MATVDLVRESGSGEFTAEADATDLRGTYPLFILGSPRSGTSTLAYLAKEHLGYAGHAEGHLFDLLFKLREVSKEHFRRLGIFDTTPPPPEAGDWLARMTVEMVGVDSVVDGLAATLSRRATHLYGPRWFDKTPGSDMIRAAPLLARVLPHARFVHVIRDPIGNIESRLRKFPSVPFKDHCTEWVESAIAWLDARQELPPNSYVELMTHELTTDPRGVTERIVRLLADHPEIDSAGGAPTTLPVIERTSGADPSRLKSLGEMPWGDEDKRAFEFTCGPILRAFDFPMPEAAGSTRTVVLPPPYGQRDVTLDFGTHGGIWPQLHNGAVWIFMHPASAGPATSIRYANVRLGGTVRVQTRFWLNSPSSAPIEFTVQVRDPRTGELAASRQFAVRNEEVLPIAFDVELPESPQNYDVSVSNRSTTGSVDSAWSLFLPLTLTW